MKQQRSNYCHAVNKLPGNLFRTRKYVICDSQNLTEKKSEYSFPPYSNPSKKTI